MQLIATKLCNFLVIFVMLAFVFCSIANSATISQVSVSGRAAIVGNDENTARRNALEDALYSASLKSGTDISSTAISQNGVLIRDVIKLDNKAHLVDFNISRERNTGTHYIINLDAYFAETPQSECPDPHYPTIAIMAPTTRLAQNVDVHAVTSFEDITTSLNAKLIGKYPGKVDGPFDINLDQIKSSNIKNPLFDYKSLTLGASESINFVYNGDFILSIEVLFERKQGKVITDLHIKLSDAETSENVYEGKETIATNASFKTPIKAINVLLPTILRSDDSNIDKVVDDIVSYLTQLACAELETKLISTNGELKIAHGSRDGVKVGDLAYVTDQVEYWSLVEVTSVSDYFANLAPVNKMKSANSLANKNIRMIGGSLQ